MHARLKVILLAVLLMLGAAPAPAVQPDEMLPDRALEARARALSRELRCMVCQNQSIDDSDAPLARDLRLLVRERLKSGDSDDAVLSFLTARYGDFVLLKPPFAWYTAVLWLGPAVVLMVGVIALFMVFRRRPGAAEAVPGADAPALTAAEEARLAEITRAQRD
jgi:cytochrome c-type biogenesis protein CcmH